MRIPVVTLLLGLFISVAAHSQQPPTELSVKLGPLQDNLGLQTYGASLSCAKAPQGSAFFVGSPSAYMGDGFVYGYSASGSTLYTQTDGSSFGSSVVSMGDINSDGVADFLAGFTGGSSVGVYQSTSPSTYSITSLSETAAGISGFSNFGLAISPIGNTTTVAIGAPAYMPISTADGLVSFFNRNTGSWLHNCSAATTDERFGSSLDSVGDLDNDNIPDLLVGSPGYLGIVGKVEVISVGSGVNCTRIFSLPAATPGYLLGNAVATVGDVNSDGKDDFIASGIDDGNNGIVILYSGADGSTLCELTDNNNLAFGTSLAGVGDNDLNGIPEFAVGIPRYDSFNGRVEIYEYNPSSSGCEIKYVINSPDPFPSPEPEFGQKISGGIRKAQQCDFESDGTQEVLVSTKHSSAGFNYGNVYAFSFPTFTPSPTATATIVPSITPTPVATVPPVPTVIPTVTPTAKPGSKKVYPSRSRFNFRILQNGNFNATNVFDTSTTRAGKAAKQQVTLKGCKVSLIARTSSSSLDSVSDTRQIAYSKKASATTRFSGRKLQKTEKDSANKHYILHVRAKNVCGDKVFYSNVASRYLNCGVEPKIGVEQFASGLINKIR